ncbi:hypothetical protein GCM10009839_56600 [Catenulispora yoronensis]|uniref:Uncharacterized protein n=1 Tax=Catenulispora yoronensis TaxID=450799 RepID=A0ABP5GIP2_9ACTN
MVFAPPKCSDLEGERDRFIPAADAVLFAVMAHADAYPPAEITLPWMTRDGEPYTRVLFFTSREGKPLNKNYINWVWKGARELAGIIKATNDKPIGRGRKWEQCRDKMMHAGRHDYATQRLGEGMDIFALRQTGPRRPGLHTPQIHPRAGNGLRDGTTPYRRNASCHEGPAY